MGDVARTLLFDWMQPVVMTTNASTATSNPRTGLGGRVVRMANALMAVPPDLGEYVGPLRWTIRACPAETQRLVGGAGHHPLHIRRRLERGDGGDGPDGHVLPLRGQALAEHDHVDRPNR